MRGAEVSGRTGARSKGERRTRVRGVRGQNRTGAWSNGSESHMDVAGRGALGQGRASGTMMGPEFENPANNWYRASGDSVTRMAWGSTEQ